MPVAIEYRFPVCFDYLERCVAPAVGLLVVERLADDSPDRKIQFAIRVVSSYRAVRQPHRTQLQCIVGEQRRVETIGNNIVVHLQKISVGKNYVPVAKAIRNGILCVNHNRRRYLFASSKQHAESCTDNNRSHDYPKGAARVIAGSFSCWQRCCAAPTTILSLLFSRSAFSTCASPLSMQMAYSGNSAPSEPTLSALT